MRREWEFEDLLAEWSLTQADQELIANKYGATRLGFCLMLKFFEIDARFPRHVGEIPAAAVQFMASQVGVPAEALAGYDFAGRAIKYHRAQIREAHGFAEFTRSDEDKMIAWLATQVCPTELNLDRQRLAITARCRALRLEPPGRVDRILGAANAHQRWWGNGTACASDSKKFGSWESNIMTEWHNRYRTGVGAGSPELVPTV